MWGFYFSEFQLNKAYDKKWFFKDWWRPKNYRFHSMNEMMAFERLSEKHNLSFQYSWRNIIFLMITEYRLLLDTNSNWHVFSSKCRKAIINQFVFESIQSSCNRLSYWINLFWSNWKRKITVIRIDLWVLFHLQRLEI